MTDQECFELINCATSATQRLYVNRRRWRLLLALVRQGYLVPLKERDNPAYDPSLLSALEDGTMLVLTDKAKAYILALNPADFEAITWFSRSQDVISAQKRLRE